jgi:hypothetical protein
VSALERALRQMEAKVELHFARTIVQARPHRLFLLRVWFRLAHAPEGRNLVALSDRRDFKRALIVTINLRNSRKLKASVTVVGDEEHESMAG